MPVPTRNNRDDDGENGQAGHSGSGQGEQSRDGSPSIIELRDNDFPGYFSERDGRLFHSSTTSPYPLPVDTPEQERQKAIHLLLKHLIGANYFGPVPDILVQEERQKNALDLCTGTGTWVTEMAQQFPHVYFRGIDIVPIATRSPPPNVDFEMGDITEDFRWENGKFDLVHARSITLAVNDYRTVLPEVIRVLRPGGLFLSCEWDSAVLFHPDSPQASNPALHAPACTNFFRAVRSAYERKGIQTSPSQIKGYLEETGAFRDLHPVVHYWPIGLWHPDPIMQDASRAFLKPQARYAESVRPLLVEFGLHPEDVDALIANFVTELSMVQGLVWTYRVVYGIKSQPDGNGSV